MQVVQSEDGIPRCWWGTEPEIYRSYHDDEWGRPTMDDNRLFEKVCLEGFQAGLSWLTILRKRDNFRAGFEGFDPEVVAGFGEPQIARLLDNAGIVRHEGKIRSTINNAQRALDLIEERGSLCAYFWSWAGPEQDAPTEITPTTATSSAMSKDLKKRGWSFVGPTTIYAFMQAMGLVNDHLAGCHVREECADERRRTLAEIL
jgi:DNA-3-methyladenine glycosylase I